MASPLTRSSPQTVLPEVSFFPKITLYLFYFHIPNFFIPTKPLALLYEDLNSLDLSTLSYSPQLLLTFVLLWPNWISCLTVKSLSHQHFQFLDFFIPSFHCFGFNFQEVGCEELSVNTLLRRWFWEVRVKAWRSETEKGRKPLQGVFRSRLLLEATKAQFNCEPLGSCEKHISELPSHQR